MEKIKVIPRIDKNDLSYKYKIVGIHKKKGIQEGKKIFDTFYGADMYLNKVIKPHKNYDKYILFIIKAVK